MRVVSLLFELLRSGGCLLWRLACIGVPDRRAIQGTIGDILRRANSADSRILPSHDS